MNRSEVGSGAFHGEALRGNAPIVVVIERSHPRQTLEAICNWRELAVQARFRASALAELCGASRRALERFFRLRWQVSPQNWLDRLRQEMAERLAAQGWSTKQIARALDYGHAWDFCRAFTRQHGFPPRALRSQLGDVAK